MWVLFFSSIVSLPKKFIINIFFFLFSTLYTIHWNCYSLQIHCFFIFQWKIDYNRECWWPCSCYMEFFKIMYTFLNFLFSMFFILKLFSFSFLMTYMDLFLDYKLWNLSFPYYLRFSYPVNGKQNIPISLLDSLWSFKSKCS